MHRVSDQELLELAGKAAGIMPGLLPPGMMIYGSVHTWNPLTDGGDALRLAVKLRLVVDINDELGEVWVRAARNADSEVFEPLGDDPHAATRRAIVRSAAGLCSSPMKS